MDKVNITKKKVIFFDFDGVIKDSVGVKANALRDLFAEQPAYIQDRVVEHHLANGGLSRYVKFPLYFDWCHPPVAPADRNEYYRRFSDLCIQGVTESQWIDGAYEFLSDNPFGQTFFLASATPTAELAVILRLLGIEDCFSDFTGSEIPKAEFISQILKARQIDKENVLFIGDSDSDYQAAIKAEVDFMGILGGAFDEIRLTNIDCIRSFSHWIKKRD